VALDAEALLEILSTRLLGNDLVEDDAGVQFFLEVCIGLRLTGEPLAGASELAPELDE
jgi:hypothetical protein